MNFYEAVLKAKTEKAKITRKEWNGYIHFKDSVLVYEDGINFVLHDYLLDDWVLYKQEHIVKTNSSIFQFVWDEKKLSEIRFNDRGYLVGDFLVQREWDDDRKEFAERAVRAKISHITKLCDWIPNISEEQVVLHLDYNTLEFFTDYERGLRK